MASQRPLAFPPGLCIDLFAGGGVASLGLARAYREPDIAINHDATAVAVHRANHPHTRHFTCDVFEVDPVAATGGRPVGVLWASPDCRHHSKAAGRKPRSKRVRGLAWVVVKWARAVRPRLIHLENVEEFADWGPLLADGTPCPVRKGITFRRWVRQLERMGYVVEAREVVAADFGAPTTRKRLYVIARCDGAPIVWPAPTHHKTARAGLAPWRAAGDVIDWSIPSCSIFADKVEARAWAVAHKTKGVPQRPLAEATKRRIARGLWRYSLAAERPYIVPMRDTLLRPVLTECANASTQRTFDTAEPLRTQCAQVKGGHFALAAAHVAKFRFDSAGHAASAPMPTITAGGAMKRDAGAAHALGIATAYFEQAAGGPNSNGSRPRSGDEPLSTVTVKGCQQQIVTAYLVKSYSNGGQWSAAGAPLGAITTKDRREQCPHWDMEEDSHRGRTCCNAVIKARDELLAARAALKRQADAR